MRVRNECLFTYGIVLSLTQAFIAYFTGEVREVEGPTGNSKPQSRPAINDMIDETKQRARRNPGNIPLSEGVRR